MSIRLNSISKMNELCQKNGFSFVFEKTVENIVRKHFKMRLQITNPANGRILNYIGECNTVQNAKHSAAKKAIADQFVIKLKCPNNYEVYQAYSKSLDPINGRRPDYDDQRSDYDEASSTADSVRGAGPNAVNKRPPEPIEERNFIYDLYLEAKKLNVRLKIDFVSSQKGSLTSEVVVKLVVGSRTWLGIGKDDLDAIQNLAKQIDLNNFEQLRAASLKTVNLDLPRDSNDYMTELNVIHLTMNKNLESLCLLHVENVDVPLYLFKCELGELISYGLDDNRFGAQNLAAFTILKNLRSKLENEIYQLDRQSKEILAKKNNIKTILAKMDSLEDGRKLEDAFAKAHQDQDILHALS